MDETEAWQRLRSARVGHLATVGPGGRPHVVPFVFAADARTIYWSVDSKPKRSKELQRLSNIRADPRVQMVVDEYEEDWQALWWVRASGTARILQPGDEWDRAMAMLAEKYPQYRAAPPPGPVVAIDIVEVARWDALG